MHDPVVCTDGHTYEKKAIETWLLTNNTSPLTNLSLTSKFLLPNHSLRILIQSHCETHGLYYKS